jgi:hypothetical protein
VVRAKIAGSWNGSTSGAVTEPRGAERSRLADAEKCDTSYYACARVRVRPTLTRPAPETRPRAGPEFRIALEGVGVPHTSLLRVRARVYYACVRVRARTWWFGCADPRACLEEWERRGRAFLYTFRPSCCSPRGRVRRRTLYRKPRSQLRRR